jgi:MFS transporter, DHA2 family, multidrug resistance protein
MNRQIADAPRAGRREWIGLAVLALPCLLYSMDLTVLNLAVPSLTKDLQPSSTELLWIMDIYGFMVAGALITMGNLGDRIGRRRLLLIGAAAFGITSVIAAFATSPAMLIGSRALLGIAGATLAPSTLSLISNMFLDSRQRTFAIGVWIASYSAGAAIGPLVGGVLLEYFWWGSVFLVGVPVMLLLLVLGPMLLPEFRNPEAGRLDPFSAILSLGAVLGVIYGLKQIAEGGLAGEPLLVIAAGLAAGVVFARRQSKLDDPLIDLHLFRVPAFSASLATMSLAIFAMGGFFFFFGQYLQLVRGLSPLKAGLWTVPSAAGFVAGSMLAPVAVRRMRPAYAIASGLALASAAFAVLAQIDTDTSLFVIVGASVLLSLGLCPIFVLGTDLIVGAAPPERAGAASAISETNTEFGVAVGIAILGSVGSAVYRGQMADNTPNGVSPEAAAHAQDTLGGAMAVAGQLPAPLDAALLDSAREAFTQALAVTAGISSAVVLASAVVAAVLLRKVGASSHSEAEQAPDVVEFEAPIDLPRAA